MSIPASRQARPVARRRPRRDDVRRALLDAASTVFARRGIDASSVDDVAEAAGFTKGAVYSNFGSKSGLVDALVEERTQDYLHVGLEAVDGVVGPMTDKARLLGDRLTRAADEQHDWHLLFLELWQRAVRDEQGADAFVGRRAELRDGVAAALTHHAVASGTPLPLSADELATVLMALVNGFAIERMLPTGDVADDLLGRVLALLVGAPPPTS